MSLEIIGICTINLRNNINIFSVYAVPSTDINSFQQGCDDLFTIAAFWVIILKMPEAAF